jgi:hypothetical protein
MSEHYALVNVTSQDSNCISVIDNGSRQVNEQTFHE